MLIRATHIMLKQHKTKQKKTRCSHLQQNKAFQQYVEECSLCVSDTHH